MPTPWDVHSVGVPEQWVVGVCLQGSVQGCVPSGGQTLLSREAPALGEAPSGVSADGVGWRAAPLPLSSFVVEEQLSWFSEWSCPRMQFRK